MSAGSTPACLDAPPGHLAAHARDLGRLSLARREFMKRNHFIKGGPNGCRHHERAVAIENGTCAAMLRRRREQVLGRGAQRFPKGGRRPNLAIVADSPMLGA